MAKFDKGSALPAGWNGLAHKSWVRGDAQSAINIVLADLNRHGAQKPLGIILQFAFYLFNAEDFEAAARILEGARAGYPKDPQLLLNLAVCLTKTKRHELAADRLTELIAIQPDNAVAWDALCNVRRAQGRFEDAAQAGTQALTLKDEAQAEAPSNWKLPAESPSAWLRATGKAQHSVLSFSLWGSGQSYLRGAIDNTLAAAHFYPGWQVRFYLDDTVPVAVRETLATLGADVRMETAGQNTRQRLTWRFKVADDPHVGRFVVRDADSVVNQRERSAVEAWIASDRWFHVMRDWWTHTDLMLAGMWGGIAGALPKIEPLLKTYTPPAVATSTIDQWFLRDKVWRYVRTSCLIHDRCFPVPNAVPWPDPAPADDTHVGMNDHILVEETQATRLREALDQHVPKWREKLGFLEL
ncbi:tetratricopeptide repeat protein [Achromobacter pestifer]